MDLTKQDPISARQAEEEDVESGSKDEYKPTIEKWHDLVRLIRETTKQAFPASPKGDGFSDQAFQCYWRDVFDRLAKSIQADADIPIFLTSPPVKKFTMTLFDEKDPLGCPCGLPDVDPNIVLENANGVTKEDFIKGFVSYMYGEKQQAMVYSQRYIESDDEADDDDYDDDGDGWELLEGNSVLVYDWNWMSCGRSKSEEGGSIVYGQCPNIFLYCCGPEDYSKKCPPEEKDKKESKL